MEEILKCYRVLDVSAGAPQKAVKKAYRQLVKKWHPDQFGDDPDKRRQAEEKLKDINLAFERIQQSPDLLKTLFRSQRPGGHPSGQPRRRPQRAAQRGNQRQTPSPHEPAGAPDKRGGSPRSAATTSTQARRPVHAKARAKNAFQWQTAFATLFVVGLSAIALHFLLPGNTPKPTPKNITRQSALPQPRAQPGFSQPAPSAMPVRSSPEGMGSSTAGLSEMARILAGSQGRNVGPAPSFRSNSELTTPSPVHMETAGEFANPEAQPPLDQSAALRQPGSSIAASETLTLAASEGPPMISETLRQKLTNSVPQTEETSPSSEEITEANNPRGLEYASGEAVREDSEATAASYRVTSEAGHSIAQKNLGMLHAPGKGVETNEEEAARWLEQSASAGNPAAGFAGGLRASAKAPSRGDSKRDSTTATYAVVPQKAEQSRIVKTLPAQPLPSKSIAPSGPEKGSEKLNPQEQFERGLRYATEFGKQDFAEAAKWYRLAAEAGHREAQKNLGFLYESGTGVKQDDTEAAKWFRRAEDNGGGRSPTVSIKSETNKASENSQSRPPGKNGKTEAEYRVSSPAKPN